MEITITIAAIVSDALFAVGSCFVVAATKYKSNKTGTAEFLLCRLLFLKRSYSMATTFIKPIRASKGKSAAQTMTDRISYILNPKKTRQGELTAGYGCDPRTAAEEFFLSKQEYGTITGRQHRKRDVLLYHMRQSFKPGEITPEEALRIGHELAMRFTKGKQAFVVATHEDTAHIHCHIMISAVNTDSTRKFKNFWGSSFAVRRLSDMICLENGLSIIENPKPSEGHYGTWLGENKEPSQRAQLEQIIEKVLAKQPASFEDFIRLLEAENCEFKRSRRSVRLPGKKGFLRLSSLSDDYKEDAIRERIAGQRVVSAKEIAPVPASQKLNLLIDLQNSIKAQNSPGYAHWAKVFSLKQVAKTLLFLQDNKLDELEKLSAAAQQAKDAFNDIQTRIHAIDERQKEIATLQKHIGAYAKTRGVYADYKKSGFSKKFRAAHEKALTDHKAARAHFDQLNLAKLPTIAALKQEYAALAAEKSKLYRSHGVARSHMQEVLIAERNVKMLLSYKGTEPTRAHNREGR